MTSAISQLVYMPISGQSDNQSRRKTVTDRQKHRNTERQKHRNTHLNFIKIDNQLFSKYGAEYGG